MREKKKNTYLSKKEEEQRLEKIEFIKLVQKRFAEEKAPATTFQSSELADSFRSPAKSN